MISVVVPQFHATTEAERVIQFGMNILTKGFGNLQTEIAQQIEDLINVLPSINQAVIISPATSTRNIIQPSAAAVIPLTIRGAASQSANLLVLEDSAGTDLTYFTSAGNLVITPLTASLPVFTNGSKQLVSNAMTGTGSVVMSASPTGTGTWALPAVTVATSLTATYLPALAAEYADGATTSFTDLFTGTNAYWDYTGASVTGGQLRPSAANTQIVVESTWTQAKPTGSNFITAIANINYQLDNGYTIYGGLNVLADAGANHLAGYGYKAGQVGFGIADTSFGDIYFENLGEVSGTGEVKVEVTTTEIKTYLDGVLKHTRTMALPLATISFALRVSTQTGGLNPFMYANDFVLYGAGYPDTRASNRIAYLTAAGLVQRSTLDHAWFPSSMGTANHLLGINSGGTAYEAKALVVSSAGVVSAGTWQGTTVAQGYGGTGFSTYTLGDIIYSSATNVLSKLAGNTTATLNILTQTGNGAISAAPAWSTLAALGGVSGSGVDNQVATWSGASTQDGSANLTFDGSTLAVTGALTVSTTAIITGALTAQSTLAVTGNFAVNTSKFTVNASTGNTVINAPNGTGNTSLTIHALHDGTGPNSGEAFSVINDDTALEVVSIMGNGAATFLNASVEQLFVNSTIPTSPGIYDTSTWNNGAVNHEAWVASITNTASGGSSNLIRMTVSEVDAFRVSKIGDGYFSGDIEAVDISGSVFTASRLAVAQGTITTDVKNISATVTWNNAAVDFIAWDLQAVSSASGAASKLVRLRTGVIETFSIGKLGVINSYDLVGFGSRFLYANAAGDIVPGGLTSTYITGTGTDNQIATWSGTSTQDGSANLTFDGSTLAVTGALTVSTTAIITGALTAQSTLGVTGTSQFTGDITLVTGCDFILGTTGAGHKWATGATQLQAWWGATPVDQPAHIADPTGGAIVDAEARTAINAILAQLAETGLQAAA